MIVPAGSDIPSAGSEPTPNEVLEWAGSLARCATGVPCGDATDRWITASSGLPGPGTITIESNVRAVLTKVRTNEVDVGLVYRTDALIAAATSRSCRSGRRALTPRSWVSPLDRWARTVIRWAGCSSSTWHPTRDERCSSTPDSAGRDPYSSTNPGSRSHRGRNRSSPSRRPVAGAADRRPVGLADRPSQHP